MAGALVVEAVAGGQARPVGLACAAHQGGHATSVQRPGFAEVHKVQDHPLTYTCIRYFVAALSWYVVTVFSQSFECCVVMDSRTAVGKAATGSMATVLQCNGAAMQMSCKW